MNDDELRARLARSDPQAAAPVSPVTSDLLERLMTSTATSPVAPAERRTRRSLAVGAAAAAAVAVAATAGVLATRGDDPAPSRQRTTLALSLPGSDVMASCVPFDVAFLRDMPVAFAGTVSAVDGDTVTLAVTTWHKGGTADVVTLSQPGGNTSVALDGVEFKEGGDYLVAATEGNVNGCGFSGEATPQLQQAYTQAFGG